MFLARKVPQKESAGGRGCDRSATHMGTTSRTATSDNGKEFADHPDIACSLELDFYFATS